MYAFPAHSFTSSALMYAVRGCGTRPGQRRLASLSGIWLQSNTAKNVRYRSATGSHARRLSCCRSVATVVGRIIDWVSSAGRLLCHLHLAGETHFCQFFSNYVDRPSPAMERGL